MVSLYPMLVAEEALELERAVLEEAPVAELVLLSRVS
jgi:hypothetical protein